MIRSAVFSDCQKYRYSLGRKWGKGNKEIAFVGLNPSTADAEKDDPTIRRCIKYAQNWGYDGLQMLNLFAYRATDPEVMKQIGRPIGRDNDHYIKLVVAKVDKVVACWGNHGTYLNRDLSVRGLISNLYYLKLTSLEQPSHPLYLSGTLQPILFYE